MVSTAEGIELITAETGRIKAYLRGTGPDQWGLDSPCEGWTVGDVIGHLGWAAEFFSDAISQGRSGITSAPQGLPEIGTMPHAELPDFIARMAKAYNRSAGSDLADAFASSADRLGGIFSSMEDDDWSKECFGLRMLQPASAYVAIRISEVVIHYWDIRYPSNPKAPLSPDLAARKERRELALDRIVSWCLDHIDREVPTVIEGAGGVMSPIASDGLNLDLIRELLCLSQRIRIVRKLEEPHLTGTPDGLHTFMSRPETIRQVPPETLRVDAAHSEVFHHHVGEVE